MKKTAKNSNFQHVLSQKLIEKFIKKERFTDRGFWGREIKILKKLLNRFPSTKFWVEMELGFQLNSFAFFLSESGQEIIRNKWGHFILEKPLETEYAIGNKVGEDLVINKPKTLMEIFASE